MSYMQAGRMLAPRLGRNSFLAIHSSLMYWRRFFSESDDGTHLKSCDISTLGNVQCGKNERCISSNSEKPQCKCQRDFHLVNGECIRITSAAASVDATTLKPEHRSESGGTCTSKNTLKQINASLNIALLLKCRSCERFKGFLPLLGYCTVLKFIIFSRIFFRKQHSWFPYGYLSSRLDNFV